MKVSYAKLNNGLWGVRVLDGSVKSGSLVSVQKKDGTVRTETIEAIVWKGGAVQLCSIKRTGRAQTGGAHYERGVGRVCDECGEVAKPGTRCWETGASH